MNVAVAVEDEPDVEGSESVTPLELFFDLVFVLAITQCTAAMADDPTWGGLLTGLATLAALWWMWVGYAWLTNEVSPEAPEARLLIFAAMAALLVVALAVPGAFADDSVAFALGWLVVSSIHIFLFVYASPHVDVRQSVLRLAPYALSAPLIVLVASGFDGVAQGLLWALALAVGYAGGLATSGGWSVSPGHFAERHGLIIIIALGESIVAIGVGADLIIDAGTVVAAALGMAVVAALWWTYFDVAAIVAERRLHAAKGAERARIARDAYSYLHLPMIAGIVLLALGLKKTLGANDEPLEVVTAFALYGGAASFLLAHVAFRYRNTQSLAGGRLLVGLLLLALVPAATEIDAILALAAITAILVGLVVLESRRTRVRRAEIKAGG